MQSYYCVFLYPGANYISPECSCNLGYRLSNMVVDFQAYRCATILWDALDPLATGRINNRVVTEWGKPFCLSQESK